MWYPIDRLIRRQPRRTLLSHSPHFETIKSSSTMIGMYGRCLYRSRRPYYESSCDLSSATSTSSVSAEPEANFDIVLETEELAG